KYSNFIVRLFRFSLAHLPPPHARLRPVFSAACQPARGSRPAHISGQDRGVAPLHALDRELGLDPVKTATTAQNSKSGLAFYRAPPSFPDGAGGLRAGRPGGRGLAQAPSLPSRSPRAGLLVAWQSRSR